MYKFEFAAPMKCGNTSSREIELLDDEMKPPASETLSNVTYGYKAFYKRPNDELHSKTFLVKGRDYHFVYTRGKIFQHRGIVKLYHSGFHFCKDSVVTTFAYLERPYLDGSDVVVHHVKAYGDVITDGRVSVCGLIEVCEPISGAFFGTQRMCHLHFYKGRFVDKIFFAACRRGDISLLKKIVKESEMTTSDGELLNSYVFGVSGLELALINRKHKLVKWLCRTFKISDPLTLNFDIVYIAQQTCNPFTVAWVMKRFHLA